MNTRAGTRRLVNPYSVALVMTLPMAVAAAQSGGQAGGGNRVMVRKIDTTVRSDSATLFRARQTMAAMKAIDSLVRVQNQMAIGSPEYQRIDEQLQVIANSMLPGGMTFVRAGTMPTVAVAQKVEAMRKDAFSMPRIVIDVTPKGWLGFTADGYNILWDDVDGEFVHYYQYPTVVSVRPNSPASTIGLQIGDSLLAYDGQDLRRNTINLTKLLEPGRKIALRVRQDGETKDLSIVVAAPPPEVVAERRSVAAPVAMPARATTVINGERVAPVAMADSDRRAQEKMVRGYGYGGQGGRGIAPTAARGGVLMAMPAVGLFGAGMTDLEASAVAKLTQQKATHGVLVTRVTVGTPAERMGLESGDMIITVGDVDVYSVSQLSRELSAHGPNRTIQLSVVRAGGKIEKLTYEPR